MLSPTPTQPCRKLWLRKPQFRSLQSMIYTRSAHCLNTRLIHAFTKPGFLIKLLTRGRYNQMRSAFFKRRGTKTEGTRSRLQWKGWMEWKWNKNSIIQSGPLHCLFGIPWHATSIAILGNVISDKVNMFIVFTYPSAYAVYLKHISNIFPLWFIEHGVNLHQGLISWSNNHSIEI